MRHFPGRLHHIAPAWAPEDSSFHIRVRCHPFNPRPLTEPSLAPKLLESVRLYAQWHHWWVHLFLLMPDHWHAILSFADHATMSTVIGNWKRFHARTNGVHWQENFFDHRLRTRESFEEKVAYIRNNPVAKGLCQHPEEWPWFIDSTSC